MQVRMSDERSASRGRARVAKVTFLNQTFLGASRCRFGFAQCRPSRNVSRYVLASPRLFSPSSAACDVSISMLIMHRTSIGC
jgi:hypothetical protein